MKKRELEQFLNNYFKINLYDDYGPNGLQIEGKEEIKKIAFSVSATKDSIQQAIQNKADALIVHHGLFWKFHGPKTITGPFANRIIPLIKNDINLFAYHLPLDGHSEIGNAISLAKQMNLINCQPFFEGKIKGGFIGAKGEFQTAIEIGNLKNKLEALLKKPILISTPDDHYQIKTIGIITGGANSEWKIALKEGLDAYLTGEMSEHDWHDAKEAGICMIAGGHHATESFGIRSLQEFISQKFEIDTIYIDSDNPA